MASPQAALHFASRNKVDFFNVDADLTTAAVPVAISNAGAAVWLDMKGYSGIFVLAGGVNLTGAGPKSLSIMADEESDGTGGNVEIVASTSDVCTAEGGYMIAEATAEQIAQEGADNSKDLRYVSIKLGLANANDEAAITVVRYGPRFSHGTLTAGSAANASIS
jgi:hypothetical protein